MWEEAEKAGRGSRDWWWNLAEARGREWDPAKNLSNAVSPGLREGQGWAQRLRGAEIVIVTPIGAEMAPNRPSKIIMDHTCAGPGGVKFLSAACGKST